MITAMTTTPLTCTVPGCSQPRASRWRCADHYARGGRVCSLDGCSRKHYGSGLCQMHWARQSTHGSVGTVESIRQAGRTCTFDGCEKPHQAKGYCVTHYTRMQLWGDPAISVPHTPPPHPGSAAACVAWKGDNVGYSAVHWRLRQYRGRARDQTCQCGAPANTWAYDHEDPHEKTSIEGPYSTDLARYIAMCWVCHNLFDRAVIA